MGQTGGIMDYGNGLYDGVFQFHSQYRKNEMCTHINSKINSCSSHFFQDDSATNPTPSGRRRSVGPTPASTEGPTPAPTEGPTSGPMAWEFVRGSASGSKSPPHCHHSKYSELCNAENAGKVYYGNAWDAVGGDVTSIGNCAGGWITDGWKTVDRVFECKSVPAPAPTPAPQYSFVYSSASGNQPAPHCHTIDYSPECNAENEGKSYYTNWADSVGGDAQALGECGGQGWLSHGPKSVDSKFTCTFIGDATDAPSPMGTDAPSPEGTLAPGPSGPEGPSGPPGPPGFQGPPGPPR